ncbi:hypothetical protein KKA93_02535 [Patescibacteria group bacterium]|nr:hypothetical protein [Patescibacteria group bacterium]MBU1663706.1 hypothetical protein [Patescibacteria group bacterium]MBU2233358.1 hypothetical protein [Patescibacteria group bacterium]MBU2264150.1 hypothetical protein [Patescibacteria group bacterium]
MEIVKKKGSSLALPANGLGGSRATSSLVAHFALQNTASNSAEKKNRPSEGVAEGGFGGNSAFHLRNQNEASPAVLLVESRTPHKSFLFLLPARRSLGTGGEEKNRHTQIKKCEENFFAGWRGFRATAGVPARQSFSVEGASLLGVLLKKYSNFVQQTPLIFTFCEIVRCFLGAKRLGMVFFRNFEGIFEIQKQRPLGNAEVRTFFDENPNAEF